MILAAFKALPVGKKLFVIGAGVVALILAVVALLHQVGKYNEALREDGRREVRAEWSAEKAGRQVARAEFQEGITAALTPQFDRLAESIGGIDTKGAEINVRLPQAIAAAPRYADPACAITVDVLAQLNAARALSKESTP